MTMRRWSLGDVALSDHWINGSSIYKTVGIITEPVVVIEDVRSGKREHHVIGSANFSQFDRLERVTVEEEIVRRQVL